ncbi:glycosyltransferase family protein [Dehalococcoidia bacterium]|nr:glycosyltransferase family protein [Dehalococcoidia bacterium]
MISIVSVYNNEDILKDWLLKSLENQTAEFELIKVDNTRNTFKSAAEALNRGGKKAKGNYLMFVHQDVDLSSNTWLEDVEQMLDSIPNLGIAGVAGRSEGKHPLASRCKTIIKHGVPPVPVGGPGGLIQNPEKVQTLDECLVIVPKSVFNRLTFDEKVCADWHLYAVDYCLSVRKLGFDVFVVPMFIHHGSTGGVGLFRAILSLGHLPAGYYRTVEKLLKKHENQVKQIHTTCGTWNTSQPLMWQRVVGLGIHVMNLGFGYLYRMFHPIFAPILLRQSYRQNGKVKSRQIANLTHCHPQEIAATRSSGE